MNFNFKSNLNVLKFYTSLFLIFMVLFNSITFQKTNAQVPSPENIKLPNPKETKKDKNENTLKVVKTPCSNFVGCDYQEGYYCLADPKKPQKGFCEYVCNGIPAMGLDSGGLSLPCPTKFEYSRKTDLSGRKICCFDQTFSTDPDFTPLELEKIKGCKSSSECKQNEFCAYTSKDKTRCAKFFSDNSIVVKGTCPKGTAKLARGPEGSYCYKLEEVKKSTKPGSSSGALSDAQTEEEKEKEQSNSSAKDENAIDENDEKNKDKDSKDEKKKGGKSSKEDDFAVYILLHTPPVFSPKLLGRKVEDTRAVTLLPNTNIKKSDVIKPYSTSGKAPDYHSYYEGEDLNFSVFIRGPEGSIPKDINSYSILVNALEKEEFGNADILGILPLTLEARDILSTSNFNDLISNPPPLNVALTSETTKGNFTTAVGNIFMLSIPVFRYTASTSGGIKLNTNFISVGLPPEDGCSKKGGKICGTSPIDIANCVTYGCWNFSKGSDLGKNCCEGLLPDGYSGDLVVAESLKASNSMVSVESDSKDKDEKEEKSGKDEVLKAGKPYCDKNTKEIKCKSTNLVMEPHCGKDLVPSCSDEKKPKPVCKKKSEKSEQGEKNEKLVSEKLQKENAIEKKEENKSEEVKEENKEDAEERESAEEELGETTSTKPECIPFSETVKYYCKEVASLPYSEKFEAGRCVSDFCDYLKSSEEKKGCCEGCEALYETLTSEDEEKKKKNIDEKEIRSCVDFNGGYCGNFKHSSSCVYQNCYKFKKDSDEQKSCCISNDNNAKKTKKFLEENKVVEERGNIYNIILVNKNETKKVKKSAEDIIVQNFNLQLPKDPKIGYLTLTCGIKDKKKKVYKSEAHIALIPRELKKEIEEAKEEEKAGTEESCTKPIITSLKVNDGGALSVENGEPIEIPLIATDPNNDIVSFNIEGISSDFKIEEITNNPGYTFTQIKGTPKKSETLTIKATAIDECKKVSEFKFNINITGKKDFTEEEKLEIVKNNFNQEKKINEPILKANLSNTPTFEKLLTGILSKYSDLREIKTDNVVIAGSRIPVYGRLSSENGKLEKLDLSKVDVSLEINGNVKKIPGNIQLLANDIVKFEVVVNKKYPEGEAKVIARNKRGERDTLATANLYIFKPQESKSINKKIKFGTPVINNSKVLKTTDEKITLLISGKNFIGKRAIINGKKAIIPKNNKYGISSITIAEFSNPELKVLSSRVLKKNKELLLEIKIPKNYKAKEEELFISTPVGQTHGVIKIISQNHDLI